MRFHPDSELVRALGQDIDPRLYAREEYERRIARCGLILDVGGRNAESRSARRLRSLSENPSARIICTDVVAEYRPDIVDDITNSTLESASFDAVYCDAILEHVRDYWKAKAHIHRVLKVGGEVFIYVPFFWCVHDRMDYHRFTFAEALRLVEDFKERKLFVSDASGYGGVMLLLASFFQLQHLPRLWIGLSRVINACLTPFLYAWFLRERRCGRWLGIPWTTFRFYFLHLYVNHGVCVWAKK